MIASARRAAAAASALLLLQVSFAYAEDEADKDEAGHAHEHEHDEHEADEVIVVTYSPLEHGSDELVIPVDQVSREFILENLGSTIGDTLAIRPGIATTSFSSGASRPVIRGQDAFRTEVLEDGLSTQDVSRESPDHGVPLNPLSARRIEVVRGPATLRYGGGASAGVVNTITERVPRQRKEFVRGDLFAGINTVNDGRDTSMVLDGGIGPVAWHIDAMLRRSNDYHIPNNNSPTVQNNTFADPTAVSAGASWIEDYGRFGFSYARFESDYGIPEDEDVQIDMDTNRYRFEGDLFDPFPYIRELRVRGVYSDYTHDEKADGEVGQTFDNDQFDGRLEALHEPILGFIGALGIQGRYRDFEAGGEAEEFLDQTDTEMFAFYLFEERPINEAFTGEFGLRIESNRVDGSPARGGSRDRHFLPVSGAVGVGWRPDDIWNLGFRASASQRAPEGVELFARGPHEATGTFEIGDADADEETSFTAELSVQANFARVRAGASAFYTYYDDYIYGELQGQTVDEEGDPVPANDDEALDLLFYETRDAVFYGTELWAEADLYDALWGTFGIDGQFDFVRARFDDNQPNKNIPRITPIRWGGGLFYRGNWVTARVGFRRTEEQNKVGAFETKTDSFTFVNASATVRISLLEDRIPVELIFKGENLNDVRARNAVAFNKEDVLLPGRSVRVGVRARF